jgi:hypothetical protein
MDRKTMEEIKLDYINSAKRSAHRPKIYPDSERLTFRIWKHLLIRLPGKERARFINEAIKEKIDRQV